MQLHRRIALLGLAVVIVGCDRDRIRSRAQGPFLRGNSTANSGLTPPSRVPLAMTSPTPPMPPGMSDEAPLIPPKPPEPGALPLAVAPPMPPKPPEVGEPDRVGRILIEGNAPPGDRVAKGSLRPGSNAAAPPDTTPPAPATPPAPSAQASNLAAIKKISAALAEKLKQLDNYEARFTRRENLEGTPGPMEEVIFRFRAEPMAVYMKNVSEAGKGREVLYNPTQHGDKIHVVVGEGDTRFLKPGTKAPPQSPDSPQVRSKSRHSIRESGMTISGNRFIAAVAKLEAGKIPADSIKYAGQLKREEFGDLPLEGVEETIRKGEQEGLPNGGTRHWFFDAKPDSPSYGLAVLVILYDANRKELEYYRYTNVKLGAKLTDADFDPAKMGKK